MLTDIEIDALMRARTERRRKKRLDRRNPALLVIDASTFVRQIERLAITLTYKVEREGYKQVGLAPMNVDISVMLRHLTYTYDLLVYVNADERRDFDPYYRQAYSFVILPLVRTMIDGFYNATALLDDPNRAISFRIGGYYRLQ